MALQILAVLLACRAVRKWDVVVCDVVKEMDLIFRQHESGGDGVDRCIAPSLVKESAVLIQRLEEVDVRL